MTKRALVTGASSGIGEAFARRLARDGYHLTLVARTEGKLKAISSELGNGHGLLVADLSMSEGRKRVTSQLSKEHYHLLVNNAGRGLNGTFLSNPIEKQTEMVRLNCDAVVELSYAFLERAEEGDALINVSSNLAFLPMPSLGLYAATKAFVTSFSESLWYEQKRRGVYVMGLCPGITDTNFAVASGGNKEALPKTMSQTPEQVVETAMRALSVRKRPTVISGIKNQMFASVSRLIPRKSTVSLMGRMS